jgi:putative phosphoesterase
MRLGIVSDIHGNLEALEIALARLVGTVDEVLVAGDAFSDHRFSNEVVAQIRANDARYILGNHELTFLGPACVNARTSPRVDTDQLRYVSERPLEMRTVVDGHPLLLVHGSPWEPYGDYLHVSNPKFARCDELGADYVVLGHTHTPFVARFGDTLVVNPGSLGRSDDPALGDDVSYAVLDTGSGEAVIERFANPLLQGSNA